MTRQQSHNLLLISAATFLVLIKMVIRPATMWTAIASGVLCVMTIWFCCRTKHFHLKHWASTLVYVVLSVLITLLLIDFALNALSIATSDYISGTNQREFDQLSAGMSTIESQIRNAPQYFSVGEERFVPAFIQRIMPIASLGFDRPSLTYRIMNFFVSIPSRIADALWALIANYIAIPAYHLYQGMSGAQSLIVGILFAAAAILGLIVFVLLPISGYVLWRSVILILLCLCGSARYYCLYRMRGGKKEIHFADVFQNSLKEIIKEDPDDSHMPAFLLSAKKKLEEKNSTLTYYLEGAIDYLLYPLIHFFARITDTLALTKIVLLVVYETGIFLGAAFGAQMLTRISSANVPLFAIGLLAACLIVILLNSFLFHFKGFTLACCDLALLAGAVYGGFGNGQVLTISSMMHALTVFIVLYVLSSFSAPLARYRAFFNYRLTFEIGKPSHSHYRAGKALLIAIMLFLSWVFLRWPITLKNEYTGLSDDYENPISSTIVQIEEGVMEQAAPLIVPEYYATQDYRAWYASYGYTAYPRLHYINNHSYATIYRTWYRDITSHYAEIRQAETENTYSFPLTLFGNAMTVNRLFLFANLAFFLTLYYLLDAHIFSLNHRSFKKAVHEASDSKRASQKEFQAESKSGILLHQ